jgi:hypothetical protein
MLVPQLIDADQTDFCQHAIRPVDHGKKVPCVALEIGEGFCVQSKGGVPDCTLMTTVTAKGNIASFEWQGYCGIGRKQALASHHGAVKAAAAGYNFRLLIRWLRLLLSQILIALTIEPRLKSV